MAERSVSLYDILDIYDAYEFAETLGVSANSVALAILRVWNKRYRPRSFRMTNKELSRLSGSVSHIERCRDKIIEECVIDEQPLFEYTSRGKNRAGVYTIHTEIVPDKNNHEDIQLYIPADNPKIIPEQSQDNTKQKPTSDQVRTKNAENGNDLREEKRREEKATTRGGDPVVAEVSPERKKESLPLAPNAKEVVSELNAIYGTLYTPLLDRQILAFNKFCSYDKNTRQWALDIGVSNKFRNDNNEDKNHSCPPDRLIGYVLGVIKNENERSGTQVIKPDPPSRTLQQRLDEATTRLDNYRADIGSDWDDDAAVQDMLAVLQKTVDDLTKEMQNADTATAG